MTWRPTIAASSKPKYLALVDVLESDIAAGVLRHGDRLPPQREIAEQLDITIATITKAIREASRRGIVTARTGSGTFIRVGGEESPSGDRSGPDLSLNTVPAGPTKSFLNTALAELGGRQAAETLCAYEPTAGSEPHRATMTKWLRQRGLVASPGDLMLTHGGQHALAACFQALTRPGDTILCEEWTYTGIRRLADLAHVKLQGVAMDGEGLEPGALTDRLKETGAGLVICTASVQNPTTATMSLLRRKAIVAACASAGAHLIEDDIYGVLSGEDVPPLAALDPQRVVHISSVSKCIAPGLRLGSVVVPERLMAPIANALVAMQWTAPTFWAEMFDFMLSSGLADRCVAAHRKEAHRRLELFREVVGVTTSTTLPSYHVWQPVPGPWRCDDFVSELSAAGVRVSPAQHFFASYHALGTQDHVRICLGGGDDNDLLRDQLVKFRNVMLARPRSSATIT